MESAVVRRRDLVALGFFTESDWLWRREQKEVVEGGEISLRGLHHYAVIIRQKILGRLPKVYSGEQFLNRVYSRY